MNKFYFSHAQFLELKEKVWMKDRSHIKYVVGILGGGLNPTWTVANELKKKPIYVTHSSKVGKGTSGHGSHLPVIRFSNILLVDDMIDSGNTIKEIKEYYEKLCNHVDVIVCVFNSDNSCGIKLDEEDYVMRTTKNTPWIVFPWEEDYNV